VGFGTGAWGVDLGSVEIPSCVFNNIVGSFFHFSRCALTTYVIYFISISSSGACLAGRDPAPHQPFLSYTTFPSRTAVVMKAWGTALHSLTSSGVYVRTSTGAFSPANARWRGASRR